MVRQSLSSGIAALALFAVAAPAMADIYMHKDERGVVHFTNIPNGDKRFKLVRKEEGTSQYARAAGAPQYILPTADLIRRYTPIIETASRSHGEQRQGGNPGRQALSDHDDTSLR